MKKTISAAVFALLVMIIGGCSGNEGGAVTGSSDEAQMLEEALEAEAKAAAERTSAE